MAEVLEGYVFKKSGEHNATYPWGKWADGQVWKVCRGVDFHVPTRSFRASSLHKAAKARGLKCRANVEGDTVIFQFYKPEPTGGAT